MAGSAKATPRMTGSAKATPRMTGSAKAAGTLTLIRMSSGDGQVTAGETFTSISHGLRSWSTFRIVAAAMRLRNACFGHSDALALNACFEAQHICSGHVPARPGRQGLLMCDCTASKGWRLAVNLMYYRTGSRRGEGWGFGLVGPHQHVEPKELETLTVDVVS